MPCLLFARLLIWISSAPPTRDLGFVFALPPPASAKISTISLTFTPSDALQLALASRRSDSGASSSQFQDFVITKLAAFWNINLSKVQLVKLSVGDVVVNDRGGAASSGGEATVRFFKGAAIDAGEGQGSGEMRRVLEVLRAAAEARR